jgi:hypothetical protein
MGESGKASSGERVMRNETICLPSNTEVVTKDFFEGLEFAKVTFEARTRVRELAAATFSRWESLRFFHCPASVEVIGEACFRGCSSLEVIDFQDGSVLRVLEAGRSVAVLASARSCSRPLSKLLADPVSRPATRYPPSALLPTRPYEKSVQLCANIARP